MTEHSPNWEASLKLPLIEKGFHAGYPYVEGLPRSPWRSREGYALFEVVTAWGLRCLAGIDGSREFHAEGVEWVIEDPAMGHQRRNVPTEQIAGWRRL